MINFDKIDDVFAKTKIAATAKKVNDTTGEEMDDALSFNDEM